MVERTLYVHSKSQREKTLSRIPVMLESGVYNGMHPRALYFNNSFPAFNQYLCIFKKSVVRLVSTMKST